MVKRENLSPYNVLDHYSFLKKALKILIIGVFREKCWKISFFDLKNLSKWFPGPIVTPKKILWVSRIWISHGRKKNFWFALYSTFGFSKIDPVDLHKITQNCPRPRKCWKNPQIVKNGAVFSELNFQDECPNFLKYYR